MKRLAGIVVGMALAVTNLAGCSNSPPTYVPTAFGVSGYCYYISSPAEAIALQYAGLCPRSWVPMLAPLVWQQRYYPYYSSPAYYTHYVPASSRSTFVTQERTFGQTYRSQISTLSKTATYKGSNGKTVTYNKITTGGGSRSRFGTGVRCDVIRDSLLKPQYQTRGGGGFGGGARSGGGYSGGGSRSGTSRTGTSRTGSGSHSGC